MTGLSFDAALLQAPLLVIAVQIVAAGVLAVGAPPRAGWGVACLAALIAMGLCLGVAVSALDKPPSRVAVAGISLVVDGMGAFGAVLVSGVNLLVVIGMGARLLEGPVRAAPLGLALAACASAGWIGALFAADALGMFVAVATAWLAGAAITAMRGGRDRALLNGAFRMLIVGATGSALLLLSAALFHRLLGRLDFASLPMADFASPALAAFAAVAAVVALAIKAGVAPLHSWLAAAVGRGGGAATSVVGVTCVVGALAVLARWAAYAMPSPQLGATLSVALAALGAASAAIGSMQAIGAQTPLRMGAYAGAAQAGCVLIGVALGSPAGFASALIQIVALAASGVALYVGAAVGQVQSFSMLDGYGRRAPLASAAISASALSLMGAPLTIGFLGRWRLVEAGVGAGWWWAAAIAVAVSLAGVFYGGRLIERMYFRRAAEAQEDAPSAWRIVFAPVLVVAIAAIAVGLAPGELLDWASAAADLVAAAP
jgi:multicomponent Na+:H+ antiporter subunit D